MRTLRGVLLVLALAGALVPVTGATVARAQNGDGGTAEDAAREIAAARDRANAAAQAWSDAQEKLETLTDEKGRLDRDVASLEDQVADLQKIVETVAVNRYIGIGTTGIPLLSGYVGPTEQAQTAVLVGIVEEASAGSFDQYQALRKQLDQKKDEANEATRQWEAAQKDADEKRQAAEDEVARLKLVEKDRLNNEAVMRALQARQQKEAEAASKAAAEQLLKDQAAAEAAEGGGSDGGDEGLGSQRSNLVSSSSSGGMTGGGGAGGRPGGVGDGMIYGVGESWVCPVQGPRAFSDTWGAPRSDGRTHQGVDMISPHGTPIVAVVDGVAQQKTNRLGGNVVWLNGNDGNRYYYAHLDHWETMGPVVKGTVIGYVGQTGNAIYSIAHLHFEIHPGGGPAVNPYATVAAYCY